MGSVKVCGVSVWGCGGVVGSVSVWGSVRVCSTYVHRCGCGWM